MHLKHLTHFTALLATPLVSAECWKDSGPQADQNHGLENLYAQAVHMSGQYRADQVRFACIDDYTAGSHYYLTVKRRNSDAWATAEFIHQGLKNEMAGCRRGGHSWVGDFEFNVDTLVGVCVDGGKAQAQGEV